MAELIHQTLEPLTGISPIVVVIGGTGITGTMMAQYYGRLASAVPSADIPRQDRLFALFDKGLGPIDETYQELTDRVGQLRNNLDSQPIVAVGHSQGGIHAAQLGLDGKVDAVVTLASPINGGLDPSAPLAAPARYYFGNPKIERDIVRGSAYMEAFNEHLATDWPAQMPLHVVAATWDELVPSYTQFGAQLPPGTVASEYIVSPRYCHFSSAVPWRRSQLPPGVERIPSLLPVDHVTLPLAHELPNVIRGIASRLGEKTLQYY